MAVISATAGGTVAGVNIMDPWIQLDGRLNAPAGTPQYPTLLNGYPTATPPNARVRWPNSGTQPPWMVAGVDYAVGIPTGTTLTDVSVSPPSGTSFATGVLTVTADNTTINGFDFSLFNSGAGVQLSCTSHNNLTVTNCKFGGTSYANLGTAPIDFRGNNLTIKYCNVDGGSTEGATESQVCMIFVGGTNPGKVTLQYCYLTNSTGQILDIDNTAGSTVVDYRFNFIDQSPLSASNHMNYLQWSLGNATPTFQFNCAQQIRKPVNTNAGQGPQFYFNNAPGGTMISPNCQYNTLIAKNSSGQTGLTVSAWIQGTGSAVASTTLSGTAYISNNYFDLTAATEAFYTAGNSSFSGWNASGNINMTTGATLVPGTG